MKYSKLAHQNLDTFAVVVLHAGKARAAASMASLVSAKPISGTVPNSSPVAGSRGCHYQTVAFRQRLKPTSDRDLLSIFCIDPFSINEALKFDQ